MTTNRRVRPAHPNDASAAVHFLRAAGGPLLSYVFSPRGDEARLSHFLEAAFAAPGGTFSHAHARIAEVEGRPLGMALGYPGAHKATIERATFGSMRRMFGWAELAGIAWRGLSTGRLVKGAPQDCYYLSMLAVDAPGRGKGLGSLLLEDLFATAKSHGCRGCALHVSVKNPRARDLYERFGFRAVAELHHPRLERRHGLPGQLLMVRDG